VKTVKMLPTKKVKDMTEEEKMEYLKQRQIDRGGLKHGFMPGFAVPEFIREPGGAIRLKI
jgi:hypothetical protein